jgi:hypothetical protein
VSTSAWILLGAVYLVMLWTVGVATFRRGHYVMFFAGIVLPVVWIAGVVIPPTPDVVAARAARERQRLERHAGEAAPPRTGSPS